MANNIYGAIGLIGGTAGLLDAIDGAALADKDIAIVAVQDGAVYFYVLDVDSALAESSPAIIQPDTTGGNKRWILTKVVGGVMIPNTVSSTPITLTATQCVSYVHYVTNAGATTVNIAAVSTIPDGSFFIVYMTTAFVLTIDPNAVDRIRLNGTALADGLTIVSDGTAGNYVVLQKDSVDGLTVIGRSGYWAGGA
jgi:hypothetical protein